MDLEKQYRAAQEADEAVVANIRRACSEFIRRHPEYVCSKKNEDILFSAMSAPENDHLVPTSLASWEDVYAQRREQLEQRPTPRRQPHAAQARRLTHDDIDRLSAIEYQRRLESYPSFAEQVNSLGPRK